MSGPSARRPPARIRQDTTWPCPTTTGVRDRGHPRGAAGPWAYSWTIAERLTFTFTLAVWRGTSTRSRGGPPYCAGGARPVRRRGLGGLCDGDGGAPGRRGQGIAVPAVEQALK